MIHGDDHKPLRRPMSGDLSTLRRVTCGSVNKNHHRVRSTLGVHRQIFIAVARLPWVLLIADFDPLLRRQIVAKIVLVRCFTLGASRNGRIPNLNVHTEAIKAANTSRDAHRIVARTFNKDGVFTALFCRRLATQNAQREDSPSKKDARAQSCPPIQVMYTWLVAWRLGGYRVAL